MSTLKIKPKKAKANKKAKLKQVESRPQFIQDMLMEAVRHHAALDAAPIKTQAEWMGEIFDDHDIVYGVYPDMTQPAGTAMAEISGGPEVLLAKAAAGQEGCFLTAMAVDDKEEAQVFAEIASLRKREIEEDGSMSEFTQMFWEKMTPGGRILNGRKTVKEWRLFVSQVDEAAKLLERYDRNDRNWTPPAE
ncbi:hypothetical protein MKK64_05235 [Methylobacterium sp. E-025]|jgi:hypothetical protein|uniref:hypothetical protein n=1 Tax=Methylobacterium sp. E-025 TaxID=2836561 RepID=UPI001FB8FB5C|nr:hypothetical protein [Methylobacterium sp. E-025]MCJ2110608.1 hypothetical protein [Methylobacterium sp. E-025]